MPTTRSQAKLVGTGAGVFGAVALGALVLWIFHTLQGQRTIPYTITCTPEQGVYGIRAGSPVRIGGLVHGQVSKVRPMLDGRRVIGYAVDIHLDQDVQLYRTTRVQFATTGIAGEGAVDILDTGHARAFSERRVAGMLDEETPPTTPLPPGSIIPCMSPVPFAGLVGQARADKLAQLTRQLPEYWGELSAIRTEAAPPLEEIIRNWQALRLQVSEDIGPWREHWALIQQHAERLLRKIGPGEDAPDDALVPLLRGARAELTALNVSGAWQRFQEWYGAMTEAWQSLETIRSQIYKARVALEDPDIALRYAMADFSIAGGMLSATKSEVMAAPWTLLGSPNPQQIAEADRVDDARLMAQAATEYERAVEGIQRALRDDARLLEQIPGLAELLAARLRAAGAQFSEALELYGRALLGPPRTSP